MIATSGRRPVWVGWRSNDDPRRRGAKAPAGDSSPLYYFPHGPSAIFSGFGLSEGAQSGRASVGRLSFARRRRKGISVMALSALAPAPQSNPHDDYPALCRVPVPAGGPVDMSAEDVCNVLPISAAELFNDEDRWAPVTR
jgi:hypothetical protein